MKMCISILIHAPWVPLVRFGNRMATTEVGTHGLIIGPLYLKRKTSSFFENGLMNFLGQTNSDSERGESLPLGLPSATTQTLTVCC